MRILTQLLKGEKSPCSTFQLEDKLKTRLEEMDRVEMASLSPGWSWFNDQFVLGKVERMSMVRCFDGEERQLLGMIHNNYLGTCICHPINPFIQMHAASISSYASSSILYTGQWSVVTC